MCVLNYMHAVTTSIKKRWELICTPNTNISKLSEDSTVQERNFIVENVILHSKKKTQQKTLLIQQIYNRNTQTVNFLC